VQNKRAKKVTTLDIKVEHLDGHIAQMVVTLPVDDTTSAKRSAAKRLAKEVRIPGFRPGKAPYQVIEQRLGLSVILEEAVDKLANVYYPKALEESDIEPIAMGGITNFEEIEQSLVITFEVPKFPNVDLTTYRDIRMDYAPEDATDEEVDEQIQALLESHAVVETVEREAKLGDGMKAKLKVRWWHEEDHDHDDDDEDTTDESKTEADDDSEDNAHDHDHDEEHSHGHEHVLIDEEEAELILREADDKRDMLPGFSAELVGLSVGDEKEFSLDLPEDFEDESLAGQTVDVTLTVAEISSRTLPTLNDEFVVQAFEDSSDPEVPQTLLELRMKTRENIRKTKEDESKAEYFDKFMEQVVDVATLDYPNVLVDQYLQDRLKRVEDDFKNQMGIGLEQYFMITGQSQEEFMESQREIAEKQLTMDFVMMELRQQEKIEVTDEDVDAEIERLLASFGEGGEAFRSFFDGAGRDNVVNRLVQDAIVERLIAIGSGNAPELSDLTDNDDDTNDADDTASDE